MDVKWAAIILLGAIGSGKSDAEERIQVDVYVQADNWSAHLQSAEKMASEAFERSDIRVTWHQRELPAVPCDRRRCIGIHMVERAPASLTPGALASARPFGLSGSLISVYGDRVRHLLNGRSNLSNVLVGYIFAHELAHVMLGYDYHSSSGILKAHWAYADYAAMRDHRLAFTDNDSERIRDGLAVRQQAR